MFLRHCRASHFTVNPDGTYNIPLNLMDPNAVLQLNAGTFPKPNLGTSQYIASIPQPTHVRDDIVRIDHAINSKFQLMGHYLHDAVTQSYFPPLWGNSSYPTVGTAMTNPSYSATIKLTQTYSPSLLNETAFLYSGNKITLTPIDGPGGTFVQPSGWTCDQLFPGREQHRRTLAGDSAARFAAECDLEPELLSVEERLRGLPVQGRCVVDQGAAPVQVRLQLAAHLQEPATAGEHHREQLYSTRATFRATRMSTFCWAMPAALLNWSFSRANIG